MKPILLVKKFLGLVEMTSGLVNASSSLPELQAVQMIFFAPCHLPLKLNDRQLKDVTIALKVTISEGMTKITTKG